MTSTTALQAARNALGWSQEKLARAINARAAAHGLPERSVPSRKTDISRWENGHVLPEPPMRAVLREIYGRTDDDLGFPSGDFGGPSGDELAERLIIARRVDEQTIELFREEVIGVRHADRRFGSAARLERLRGQITEVEGLLRHTILRRDRAPLASVLVEASTLAGWNSLDIGALDQAWTHYERAKYAAMESGSAALLAHATAEQAFVLIDVGNVDDALALFAEARRSANMLLSCCERGSRPPRGRATRSPATGTTPFARSTKPTRSCRTKSCTPSCRSSSSAAATSTVGAETPWSTSARRRRSSTSSA
jgi:transcriptional regulator with XRE-family HTH domain